MRTAALVLACAAVARAGVDGKFVGAWTAKAGPTTLLWEVCDSGAYAIHGGGETPLAGEYGTLEATGGRYSLRGTNFRADQGTYTFDGDDKVTVVSRAGTLVWERVSRTPQFTPPPKLPDHLTGLGVKESLDVARAHAAIWQPDATLVGVSGMASAEGTFDVSAATPVLNFTFHSPGTNQGLMLTATSTGDMVWLVCPVPMMNLTVPLADGFLDLGDAMKKAIAAGYKAEPKNPVQLRAWEGEAGSRTAWQVGGNPIVARNFFLDAVTGEKTTLDEVTGTAEMIRRLEEWKKGKPLALGNDFAEWRKEADLWAGKWNAGATPFEVWVTGTYKDGLRLRCVVVLYFAEGKGARGSEIQCASIAVSPKGLNGRRERKLDSRPVPLADGLILPEKAASVLTALNPQLGPEHTYLQLLHLAEGEEAPRLWPPEFGYDRSVIGGIMQQRGPVPKGERWIWRLMARRPGGESGVGIGGNYQCHIGAVHCDAKTGEALDDPAPTFGQTKFR